MPVRGHPTLHLDEARNGDGHVWAELPVAWSDGDERRAWSVRAVALPMVLITVCAVLILAVSPAIIEAQSIDQPPGQLRLVRLEPGPGSLTLHWEPVPDDPDWRPGVEATRFDVRYSRVGDDGRSILADWHPGTTLLRGVGTAASTSYEIRGLAGRRGITCRSAR